MEPWHDALLESLQDLQDIERQRRAWIEGAEPWFPAPGELLCQVFDDSSVNELLAKGPVFSTATDPLLQ